MKKTRYDKTLEKLDRKRELVIDWLEEVWGVSLSAETKYQEVLNVAYEKLGKRAKTARGFGALHSMFSNIINRGVYRRSARPKGKKGPTKAQADQLLDFYQSYAWRNLRYKVLKNMGRRCQLCGATEDNGVHMNVDHIKPLKKFWSLRLCEENLQVLCEVCNHGKGNWDETDWRPTA